MHAYLLARRTMVAPERDIPNAICLDLFAVVNTYAYVTTPLVHHCLGHLPDWVLREDARQTLLLFLASPRATRLTCPHLLRRELTRADIQKTLFFNAPMFLDKVRPNYLIISDT